MLPIAVDAMGGDRAPEEIVAGARRAAQELGVAVALVGQPEAVGDAGANAECTPQYLVQFAQMGAAFAAERYGIAEPRVGLLSIGEEDTKGTPLVKETNELLRAGVGVRFVGNVEGRDIMTDAVDVV